MSIKPVQKNLNFEITNSEQFKNSSQPSRTEKPRVSYGGGFHIQKKPEPPPVYEPQKLHPDDLAQRISSPKGYSSLEVIQNELQRLRQDSQNIEKFREPKYTEGTLHLDPYAHNYHIEQQIPGKINLQQLEVLKEQNAARILEIEAELARSKQENYIGEHVSSHQYVPVFQPYSKTPKKNKSIQDYHKKYQEKFEKYLRDKQKSKTDKVITGKEMKIPDNYKTPAEEGVENSVILKWMFKKLDKDRSGKVDKVELIQEFHQNPELCKLFGFNIDITSSNYMQKFTEIFEKIGTGSKNEISMDEFLLFFDKFINPSKPTPTRTEKSPKKILKKPSSAKILTSVKEVGPVCLLANKHMKKLEEIFERLDIHQDLVVKRSDLIEEMQRDQKIIKILSIDAVRVSPYQVLDLESMLNYIRNDGDGEEEFITWNQFLEYFFVRPVFDEAKFDGIENPGLDEIDLPSKYLGYIKEVFDYLTPKTLNKVSTYELIQAIKTNYKTSEILDIEARSYTNLSVIPSETVLEVLNRVQENSESLIGWEDLLGYFTRRGVPKEIQTGDSLLTRSSFVKPRLPSKPINENGVQTDDLEYKKTSSRARSISPKPKVTFQSQSFEKIVTVPDPFQFEEREKKKPKSIREKWLESHIQEKVNEENSHLNFQYKARNVPDEVLMPKYESLRKALHERSLEAKRTSVERTKMLEKPFSFYERDKEKVKKEHPAPPDYTFKANPIPWACTVPLYESKIQQEQALREERKSREAQKNLRKASLPPRMEMHQHIKQSQVIENKTPSPKIRVKDPPNFDKLYERFTKTLEAKKNAKQNTRVEPFLIDSRLEESKKKKEQKNIIKEQKRKQEEEEKQKKIQEEQRIARIKAKENWIYEHNFIAANKIKVKERSLSNEEKKKSPKKNQEKSGKFTLESLKPESDGFTVKDLNKKSSTVNALKPPEKNPLAPGNKHALAPSHSDSKSSGSVSGIGPGILAKNSRPESEDSKSGHPLSPKSLSSEKKSSLLSPSTSVKDYDPLADGKKKTGSSSILAKDSKGFPDAKKTSVTKLGPEKFSKIPPGPSSLAPDPKPKEKSSTKSKASSSMHSLSPSTTLEKIPEEKPKLKKAAKNPGPKKDSEEFTTKDLNPEKKSTSAKPLEYQDLKPKLKSAILADEEHAIKENKAISEKLKKRKEDSRREVLEYHQKLKEMKERVGQRSLLVESATDASNKNRAKMKVLLQIKKSLEESGLKIDSYFTDQELDLIQEAEYLTKMNRLKS